MGTPEFSVPMLKAIHDSEYELAGVVTAPDKPSGRGRKLSKSAVKQFAEKHGIPIYQPTNLKSEEFNRQLQELDPNVIVVVAFRMLPETVWAYPEYGTFNLHASLLPNYRGAAPINWAIMNGEKETGLTTFFIDEKIDTGEIIDNVRIRIEDDDDVSDLYEKMLPEGKALVMETLQKIRSGDVKTKSQAKSDAGLKIAPKLTKENMRIDWNKPAEEICNQIRGLSPFPLAWTMLVNEKENILCKIASVKCAADTSDMPAGSILIKNKSMYVHTGEGMVEILKIKMSGKRLMDVQTLLNGYTIAENSKLV